jgi:hypothetical protein
MATEITTIQGKGAPLSATELDDNFINLRDAVDGVIGGTQITESINLDTTPTVPTGEGKLYWDAADGTLAINMAGGIVKQQVGLETYFKVRNVTGTTIPNGTPVMATGVVSGTDRLQVTPAIANGTIQSVRFIGLVTEPLNNSSNGYSTCFGFVRDVNTTGSSVGETWAIGDLLYISQTTAGKLTKVAPTSGLKILAAIVVTVNDTTGILLTRATPGVIIEDVYFKAEVDTKLAEKMSTASYTGAIGNITSPLLHLPLKNSLAFSQGVGSVNFERTSTATYVDRYGMLKSVAADVPRFTADGLLIEGASTNLLTYSEQFENGAWTKSALSISANTGETTDPYGTNLADKMIDTTATSAHYVRQDFTTVGGATYTLSAYIKAGDITEVSLDFAIASLWGGTPPSIIFDLVAGSLISSQNILRYSATALSNGWWRLSITATATGAGTSRAEILQAKTGSVAFTGTGSASLYIFGAQVEAMPFVTSYIPTTSTSVTRAAEKCSLPLQDNMVKLQKSTGHTFIVDATVPIDSSAKIALGGDGSETRHLVGFYNTQVYTNNARGGTVNNALAGIDSLKKHRYAVVFTGSASAVYVDGIYKGSATDTYTAELASTIYVGSAYDSRQLFGTISNLRIYDRALTAEEVRLA